VKSGQAVGVNAGTIFSRHPVLRWVLPIGVVAVIAAATSGAFAAQTSSNLSDRTPTQLLADIAALNVPGLQGTIVEKADLGLPELPQITGLSSDGSSLLSLLSGSHTARVWYGGPSKQRVALLTTMGETDVFRNGTQLWQWNSSTKTATRTTLPSSTSTLPTATAPTDPVTLAKKLVTELTPNTVITTDSSHKVADRPVYELVFSPRPPTDGSSPSRIGSVWIAIDAATKVPVGVQIYAKGKTTPAFDVSFTSVYFEKPDDQNFSFTPPTNATIVQENQLTLPDSSSEVATLKPTVIGSGWTSIIEVHTGSSLAKLTTGGAASTLKVLTPVKGSWGSGRLLDTRLVTALITSDGRLFAGPVEPDALYAAAATHK
jgi:outer membrane lipoprotein-sorting protein